MFYGVKFVYVNLQTDGQAIWQKSKKLLYKITELEKSKNLCNRHNQVGQIIIPIRVATVREKFWKMKNFPGQGKVRELHF